MQPESEPKIQREPFRIQVRSEGDRFAVLIRSSDADVLGEVLRRARALMDSGPSRK